MILEKYSMGIGDRFAHQGKAQLRALVMAKEQVVDIAPVWNKSHREHTITGTSPADVRREADEAVKALGWRGSYYVDADHISMKNVDIFVDSSDFFTLDVAEFIASTAHTPHLSPLPQGERNVGGDLSPLPPAFAKGFPRRSPSFAGQDGLTQQGERNVADKGADESDVSSFVDKHRKYVGSLSIPGIDEGIVVTEERIETIARKFLLAVREAGNIYRHVEAVKGMENFITEVSMDETDEPQTPVELFFILAAIADESIPAQTIAPKFTGRFNKGVDYVGDVGRFAREFEEDLAVVNFAIKEFGLPENLKLSVHSGSDKFSIYGAINKAIRKYDAGLHLKTAGTTWLEELIGLAMAGGEGLDIAKEIYPKAFRRFDELCGPYATVINIDKDQLPLPEIVDGWSGEEYADALRHDLSCGKYNPNFRQILHVAYKVAAEMGGRYLEALDKFEDVISQNVTENIYERHLRRIFIDEA